jgi:nicotinamide riboside kinase
MDLKTRPLRLVVTGVESTGKTTLATQLSQHFGFPLALEAARYDARVQKGTIDERDLNRLVTLQFDAALTAEREALNQGAAGLIADTGGLVLELWGASVFGVVPEEAHRLQNWFDFYILCSPDIPWESDPLRSMPQETDRLALHQRYIQRLDEAGYHWVETKGSAPLERFLFIVEAIETAFIRHINE